MTLTKTYYPLAGLYQITDAALAYCKILMVARSGVEFNVDINYLNEGGGNFCMYQPSTGTILFNDNQPFNQDESINIVYDPNI